jgi:hypothetical protein
MEGNSKVPLPSLRDSDFPRRQQHLAEESIQNWRDCLNRWQFVNDRRKIQQIYEQLGLSMQFLFT